MGGESPPRFGDQIGMGQVLFGADFGKRPYQGVGIFLQGVIDRAEAVRMGALIIDA